jgi:hypothetical protein
MKNVFKHLTANGKEYPFVFNINVIQAITENYGKENENEKKENGIEKWAELVQPSDGSMPDLEALKFFCREAINEGIDMENDPDDEHYIKRETPRAFINDKQAGRIISAAGGFEKFAMDTVKESNDTGIEKNLITEQNQTGE